MTSLLAALQSSTRLRPEFPGGVHSEYDYISNLPPTIFVWTGSSDEDWDECWGSANYEPTHHWVFEAIPDVIPAISHLVGPCNHKIPANLTLCLSLTPAEFRSHPGCLEAFAALPGKRENKAVALVEWNEALPNLTRVEEILKFPSGDRQYFHNILTGQFWYGKGCRPQKDEITGIEDYMGPFGSNRKISLLLLSGPSAAEEMCPDMCRDCGGIGILHGFVCPFCYGKGFTETGRIAVPPLSVEVAEAARKLCEEAGVEFACTGLLQDSHSLSLWTFTPDFPPKEKGV